MDYDHTDMTAALTESSDSSLQVGARKVHTRTGRAATNQLSLPSLSLGVSSTTTDESTVPEESKGELARAQIQWICDYPGCKSKKRPFVRKAELNRHRENHFPKKLLVCPVQDCKYKKKKTWPRKDKFREHVGNHGGFATFSCPIAGCASPIVPEIEFAEHVAHQHDFLERNHIKDLLYALEIPVNLGRWKCPMTCTFEVYAVENLEPTKWTKHVPNHELSQRVQCATTSKLFGFNFNLFGVASCPICHTKMCHWDDSVVKLLVHLEVAHGSRLAEHGAELSKLLGWYVEISHQLWQYYPLLDAAIKKSQGGMCLSPNADDANLSPWPVERREETIASASVTSKKLEDENAYTGAGMNVYPPVSSAIQTRTEDLLLPQPPPVWQPHTSMAASGATYSVYPDNQVLVPTNNLSDEYLGRPQIYGVNPASAMYGYAPIYPTATTNFMDAQLLANSQNVFNGHNVQVFHSLYPQSIGPSPSLPLAVDTALYQGGQFAGIGNIAMEPFVNHQFPQGYAPQTLLPSDSNFQQPYNQIYPSSQSIGFGYMNTQHMSPTQFPINGHQSQWNQGGFLNADYAMPSGFSDAPPFSENTRFIEDDQLNSSDKNVLQ